MEVWKEKENRFLQFPYKKHGFHLSIKIRAIATIVVVLALTEHILFLSNSAYNQFNTVTYCNWTIDAPLSYFLEHQFPFLFGRIPFKLPIGIFVEVMNLSFTFGWNYMELFVMIVSLGLVTRFWQINDRLDTFKGKVDSKNMKKKKLLKIIIFFLGRARSLVGRNTIGLRCALWADGAGRSWITIFDSAIESEQSLLHLLSAFEYLWVNLWGDLIFIFYHRKLTFFIFASSSLPFIINYVYFWFSLGYLFARTLSAQFLAAQIHDASNYPLVVMKAVPINGWCIEVQRFIDQIRSQTMAFSGYKFFYLTRKSILAVSLKALDLFFNKINIFLHCSATDNDCNLRVGSFAIWQWTKGAGW